jgi:hypothetical protein
MGRARRALLHPAFFAALPLVLIAIVVLARGEWFVPRFDYAAEELAVQEAAHGVRLLGPYSHFGFFHPGPMMYYAAVPWYWILAKSGGAALVVTRLCVDIAAIAFLVVIVDRTGGRVAAWGATIGLLWFELRVGLGWFRDPWNPFGVVLPAALAIVAGAALFDGPRRRRTHAIVLVVAASYALQSHLGTGPLIALAALLGVAGFVRSARGSGRGNVLADVLVVTAVGIVCWALPLWQQLTQPDGNISAIRRFFTTSTERRPHLGLVIQPISGAVTLRAHDFGERLNAEPMELVPRMNAIWWVVLALLLIAAVVYAVRLGIAGRYGMAAYAASVPLAYGAALVAGVEVRGAVFPYLFAPALAVGVLAWTVAGAAVAEFFAPRLSAPRASLVLPATAGVALIATVAVGSGAFGSVADDFGSRFAARLEPGVRAVCARHRPVHLTSATGQWYQVLEVAAALGECRSDVELDRGLRYIVGRRRTPAHDGSDVLVLRLESPPASGAPEAASTRVERTADASLDLSDHRVASP